MIDEYWMVSKSNLNYTIEDLSCQQFHADYFVFIFDYVGCGFFLMDASIDVKVN